MMFKYDFPLIELPERLISLPTMLRDVCALMRILTSGESVRQCCMMSLNESPFSQKMISLPEYFFTTEGRSLTGPVEPFWSMEMGMNNGSDFIRPLCRRIICYSLISFRIANNDGCCMICDFYWEKLPDTFEHKANKVTNCRKKCPYPYGQVNTKTKNTRTHAPVMFTGKNGHGTIKEPYIIEGALAGLSPLKWRIGHSARYMFLNPACWMR